MNARQKLHQVHLQEWTVRFADQKASGLTVRQWCEQNNLSFHTYNYWKHLLKEEVVDQALPDIVPVSVDIQTSALGLIHSQPSSNADFICICSCRIACSFSAEDPFSAGSASSPTVWIPNFLNFLFVCPPT